MPSIATTGKNIWIASSDGDLDRVKVRTTSILEHPGQRHLTVTSVFFLESADDFVGADRSPG